MELEKRKVENKLFKEICPLCGGKLTTIEHYWEDYATWEFICSNCNASFFMDNISDSVNVLFLK